MLVNIVPENANEIDFGQYVDLYFSKIAEKSANKFASASKPLTSSSSATLTNNANVTYMSKNVDKYVDGANYDKYHKLTGTLSYTIGLPKIETPRTPVFGIPGITFFAYFEAEALTLSGSASMIKDPSKSSEISGNVTITGTAGSIEGGVGLGIGVPDLAEIVTTGAMTIDGVSVEGSFDLTDTNIIATGTLTIGEVGGTVNIKAIYLNAEWEIGNWEETFITLSQVPLGSTVLYTY
ncbi:MAG: hypothetical protein Q8T08_03790 [Ignavibacteria bacterium]|nr:hypothetical protein [Ignavibacteria bacterium]